MYKNLKIQINDQQPLNEVVKELERLGYTPEYLFPFEDIKFVEIYDDGIYDFVPYDDLDMKDTTLAELKEM